MGRARNGDRRAARSILLAITTAGADQTSAAYAEREYSVKVLEGVFTDDARFAYIATIDEKDDPFDPKVWIKSNPNLGISVYEDDLAAAAEQAKHSPRKLTPSSGSDSTSGRTRRIVGSRWTIGTTARSRPLRHRGIYGWRWTWIQRWTLPPSSGSRRLMTVTTIRWRGSARPGDRPGRAWLHDNWYRTSGCTNSSSQQQGQRHNSRGSLEELDNLKAEGYRIVEVALDPWNSSQFTNGLAKRGYEVVVTVPQTTRELNEAAKALEKAVLAHKARVGGIPVPRWMASNVAVYEDTNGSIKPDKKRSREKIDGISAWVTAKSRLIHSEPPAETRPMIRSDEVP